MPDFSLPGTIDVLDELLVGVYTWRRISVFAYDFHLHVHIEEEDRKRPAHDLPDSMFFRAQVSDLLRRIFESALPGDTVPKTWTFSGRTTRAYAAQPDAKPPLAYSIALPDATWARITTLSAHETMALRAIWAGEVTTRAGQRAATEERTPG